MRHLFVRWFVFCILLAGLQARMFAPDPCEVVAKTHADGKCHVEHGECPGGDPDHDDKCPAEHHHHHGICGHATPYAVDGAGLIGLVLHESSGLWLRHEGDVLPDGPCLEKDIPPVI
ncbi:MAG: hypothetical protein K9N23_05695 [Akkermansiaceae bacterium]|nr:hypothetical protein [Akkermansiaceae bacterium]MCF7731156.1 hypothetical protein [Akkermansiaceae bacterium]